MIDLGLSILCSTFIYVTFKLFGRYRLDTFQAIAINYFVAMAFGLAFAGPGIYRDYSLDTPWLVPAAILGSLFIIIFYVMALTSQRYGVVVTGITARISMVIPAAFFILSDPSEGLTVVKAMGIGLGLVAVYLASATKTAHTSPIKAGHLPILLFIGSGILDLLLALIQRDYLPTEADFRAFVPVPFIIASTLGAGVLLVRAIRGSLAFRWRNFVGGLALGLLNYGSIYFAIRFFGSGLMDRSSAIPTNNMGVVALSTLAGVLIFHERLSTRKILGIALAIIAILLLAFGASPLGFEP